VQRDDACDDKHEHQKTARDPSSGSFFFCEHPSATSRALTIPRAAEE
jgi:hypothetical protein